MNLVILMATYNGERFLDAQLASLRAQTFQDWQLLVRDDGSSDRTTDLLQHHAIADPRIQRLKDDRGRVGAGGNFALLMQQALHRPATAYAFCDQDDVWEPDKLRHQLDRLQRLEQTHGDDGPALVHHDLAPIDADGEPLGQSFTRRQHITHPDAPPLTTLLLQNHIPGCSMLLNRALLELACPVPTCAHLHDWWVALCATAAGSSAYLTRPLVGYRQHAGNQVGAGGIGGLLLRPRGWGQWLRKMGRIYRTAFAQADALQRRLSERSPGPNSSARVTSSLHTIDRLLTLRDQPRIARPGGLLALRFHAQNPYLTALAYLQSALIELP